DKNKSPLKLPATITSSRRGIIEGRNIETPEKAKSPTMKILAIPNVPTAKEATPAPNPPNQFRGANEDEVNAPPSI
ncbi:MAG: hypothetical protein FWD15_05590, partial [Alphaproteobacteria bacterium]|nr:hypothetical protein [Alphaproteobacteria bacterium]